MCIEAIDRFYADEEVQKLLKGQEIGNVARTSDSTLSAFGSTDTPYEYRGVLQGANGQGRVEVYTYNEQYENAAGETVDYMSPYDVVGTGPRSEEHTSELQSLMRISYAVFCLKKKKIQKRLNTLTLLSHHRTIITY